MRSSLLYEKGYASTVSSFVSPSTHTSPWLHSNNSGRGKKRRDSVPVVFPRKGIAVNGHQATSTLGPDGYSLHYHHHHQQQSLGLIPRQTKSTNYPASSPPPFTATWDPHIDDLDILYAKVNGLSSITPVASLSASSTIGPGGTRCQMENNTIGNIDMMDMDMNGSRIQQQQQQLDDDDDNDTTNIVTTDQAHTNVTATTTHHLPIKLLKMTNELMQARLDILSEAISSKHHPNNSSNNNSNNDNDDHESLVDLMNGCIEHAERMEQLASAHLVSERHLRTVLLQASHHDHSDNNDDDELDRKMTTWYHDQIRQCVHLYEQQVFMTETLQDMLLDIQHYDLPSSPPPLPLPSSEKNDTTPTPPTSTNNTRWDFTCSVASLLGLDDMQDHFQAIKYQVGLFIGQGIGTGHFIHPPRPPSPPLSLHKPSSPPTTTTTTTNFSSVSASSSFPSFCIDQLTLLPKHRWVPDQAKQQCQVSTCSLSFSLFERRHHCRRCGLLVCQQHSQHQLPLYSPKMKSQELTWSRVCDPCYTNIILPSSFPSSIIQQSL